MNSHFGEAPNHAVTITRPFFLSKTLVTQAIWTQVMGTNPSYFRGSKMLPVDSISWDDAIHFCDRLSNVTNRIIRLPTESEWEYACRGGSEHEFFMFSTPDTYTDGTEIPTSLALKICAFAWFELNSQERTHPVGEKLPNPWGLHDMVGNVWEWCQDMWHGDYAGAPTDGSAWLEDSVCESRRCVRGGAWDMDAFRCRSTYRSYDDQSIATTRSGVRIVVDI
jgi:formylglycine-generating enzyme required for sulfatase activity